MSGNAPIGSFGFKVIVNVEGQDTELGLFQEVSGLSAQLNVEDLVEGGCNTTTRKLIGNASYSNIVLKRGICKASMYSWIAGYLSGEKRQRLSGSIQILGDDGTTPVKVFKFIKGIPVKWDGPSLNVMSDAIATETLEIAHEGLIMSDK